eukprot:1716612-Lingulodinium_polyedra.AAC.1
MSIGGSRSTRAKRLQAKQQTCYQNASHRNGEPCTQEPRATGDGDMLIGRVTGCSASGDMEVTRPGEPPRGATNANLPVLNLD